MVIKRVGGAYGSKISRASQTAAACALGSYVTQRLVKGNRNYMYYVCGFQASEATHGSGV